MFEGVGREDEASLFEGLLWGFGADEENFFYLHWVLKI